MQQFLYPEMSREDRMRVLEDNADGVKLEKYDKKLSADELLSMKESLSDQYVNISKLNDEYREMKKGFTDRLKLYSTEIKETVKAVRTGRISFEGRLFQINDYDTGYAGFYDENGELISSRRLLPEEKQQTTTSVMRLAANDR